MEKKVYAIMAGQVLLGGDQSFKSSIKIREIFRKLETMNNWKKKTVLRSLRKVFGPSPYKKMFKLGQNEIGGRIAKVFESL